MKESLHQTRHVAITGGTHGNEKNGVVLANFWLRNPSEIQRSSFTTTVLITNPASVESNTRYVDRDLNRCFLIKDLQKAPSDVETKRAKEVNRLLGPKGNNPKMDFILDLHNTTANTGVVIFFHPKDLLSLEIASYLTTVDSEVRIGFWKDEENPFLPTIGRSGMTFEVGPCPWNTVQAESLLRTKRLVKAALNYIHFRNLNPPCKMNPICKEIVRVPIYKRVSTSIKWPRNQHGQLIGAIHPDLQFQDFQELSDGSPIFLMLDGSIQRFSKDSIGWKHGACYPYFINEAAYYEKDVAFSLSYKDFVDVAIYLSETESDNKISPFLITSLAYTCITLLFMLKHK